MKVTHLFWSLGYGGIETMLVNIANEQAKFGAEVSIIIINDFVETELLKRINYSVNIVLINRKIHSWDLTFIKRINKVLDEISPDIIHLHRSEIRNFINSRRARMACIVSTIHAIPTGAVGMAWRWGSILQGFIFPNRHGNVCAVNRVDKIFSISKSVAEGLSNNYGLESDIIYNGIQPTKYEKRNVYNPTGIFQMVQISRLDHNVKGQDLLIEAAEVLKRKYGKIFRLTFIGDGSSLEYLKKLVSDKGLEEDINFLGARSQEYIYEHIKDFDLFVQPSRFEGFGLTVAEAMSAFVPVLVTRGQGPSEVTDGDKYGWTFENSNIEDLAYKINYIIENYKEALQKVESSYEYVCNNFDVSVTARRYLDKYRVVMSQKIK